MLGRQALTGSGRVRKRDTCAEPSGTSFRLPKRAACRRGAALVLLAGLLVAVARTGTSGAEDLNKSDLAPGISNAFAAQNGIAMDVRMAMLMSCPAFLGASPVMTESPCAWARVGGGGLSMTRKEGVTGYHAPTVSFSLGGELALAEDWFLSTAGSYERAWLTGTDGRVVSRASTAFAGVAAKWKPSERSLLSLGFGGSYAWLDNERDVSTGGGTLTARSSPDFWSGAARVHMEIVFPMGQYYIRPYQDFNVAYTVTPAYGESGAGAFDLDVDRGDQVSFSSAKMVEFGGRMPVAQGLTLRHYAAMGVIIGNHQDWTTDASLAADPATAFSSTVPVDRYYGRFNLGLQLQGIEGLDLRMEYNGAVSGHANDHLGSLRLGYRF